MSRPRVVIVGAGFAGYRAARTLAGLARDRADITLLNPTDYFPYLPLLPQVAAGILEARRVTVSLPDTLRAVGLPLGEADRVDLAALLGLGRHRRPYRHRDLGTAVDLGGSRAVANPFGIPLSGPVVGAVTRGHHLVALPGNRLRVAADWLPDVVLPCQGAQLGPARDRSVPLETASPGVARFPGGLQRPATGHRPRPTHQSPDPSPRPGVSHPPPRPPPRAPRTGRTHLTD
ncbi:FAD-dependent oxidoreductase [Streptomyces sp. MUSC 125]|uniref:FAD-dependent oxidoreductase n=1 Tax=Streptomyces sp. MUSC 125 TaxID=1428624 RepID=UPI0018FEF12A|nr:FAD-dependent oxidoreductase [Streptomyces sp. MUSC 125]